MLATRLTLSFCWSPRTIQPTFLLLYLKDLMIVSNLHESTMHIVYSQPAMYQLQVLMTFNSPIVYISLLVFCTLRSVVYLFLLRDV